MKKWLRNLIIKIERIRLGVSNTEEKLFEKAMADSLRQETVAFVRKNMESATYFPNWKAMFDYLIKVLPQGMCLEFGVAKGKTINYLAEKTDRTLHGFDSFESFPEPYVGYLNSHDSFDFKKQLPAVRNNVKLYAGFFDKTLPGFLKENKGPVAFIHIDCDLYSSTKFVLDALKDQIKDTYVQFDEYFGYWAWQLHEAKAFEEFLAENKDIKCEYIGYSYRQILVRLTRP